MGPDISHGDRGLRRDLLLDAEAVTELGGVFHFELQPVTDDLGQGWSRQETRVHLGKGGFGPKKPGGYAVGRDAAHGAVEGLSHQVIKVHPESSPDRCLAVGPRVPGKPDARREIFVGTLEPRVSESRRGGGQGIPEVADLAIDFRRDRGELVAKPQVEGEVGPNLEIVLEIESEQVLAPAPNVVAGGDVSIKLRRSCSEEIVQRVKEILPAVDPGQGGVALGSVIEHPHFQGMAPPRDHQVIRELPDVVSKSPGIALESGILVNPATPKSNQAQLLTRDKEQLGRHLKQGPSELVAIGAVKTGANRIEDSGRENLF